MRCVVGLSKLDLNVLTFVCNILCMFSIPILLFVACFCSV